MTTTKLAEYQNGAYKVTLFSDGTKEREWDEKGDLRPLFPESIDVKISDYCDLNCPYCHESSTVQGNHGDLTDLLDVLTGLPRGIELAIGGGNPLSHPDLERFLSICKSRGFICNLTVNQRHIRPFSSLLKHLVAEGLIYGLGISLVNLSELDAIRELGCPNVVFHIIAGVNQVSIIRQLKEFWADPSVLILGYKSFGRGDKFKSATVSKNLKGWYQEIGGILGDGVAVSFDNLAISQLNIKRLVKPEAWSRLYMGDDFSFSMYIDAVEKTFAPTSRNSDRIPWKVMSLTEYFQKFSFFWV